MGFLVVVWSGNYIVGKIGLRELPPLALASFRLVLAGVVLLPVYFASMRPGKGSACVRPGSSLRDLWTFAYLGFFGVFINQGGFTLGLSYTSVSHSSLVIGFVPILILLLSWTQGLERLTTRKLLGVALAFSSALLAQSAPASTAAKAQKTRPLPRVMTKSRSTWILLLPCPACTLVCWHAAPATAMPHGVNSVRPSRCCSGRMRRGCFCLEVASIARHSWGSAARS